MTRSYVPTVSPVTDVLPTRTPPHVREMTARLHHDDVVLVGLVLIGVRLGGDA